MQTYLKTRPVWIQLLLFMGMAFGIFMVFTLIGVLLLTKATGISVLQMQDTNNWSAQPNMIYFIRGMLLIQFLGLFVIPSLLFGYFADPHPRKYLGLQRPGTAVYWVLGIVALMVALPLVEYLGILNQKLITAGGMESWMKTMEEETAKQIQFMLSRHTVGELLTNLVFISLFAGVGEELFFRGVLQRLFIGITKSPWAGIVITALIFSAFHMQFYGFFPRFLLGALLGAIYWYSGSLWPAIVAHFVYDAFIIVAVYFNPEMIKDPNASMVNPAQLSVMALVSAALTLLVVWQMIKRSKSSLAEVYKDDIPSNDQLSF